MAKVLLATPLWRNSYPEQPPLSLLYLASWIRKEGHKVWICDEPIGEDFVQMFDTIKPDVVGISGPTCGIGRAYSLAYHAKKNGVYTIMGGHHVSTIPEEALRNDYCDAVVIGEGELEFTRLIETREKGQFEGKALPNLDESPMPAFDLISMDFYTSIRKRVRNSLYTFVDVFDKCMSLMSSRGCPFNCPYCYNSFRKSPVRYKSAEKTVEEFKFASKKYGVNAITYLDDDFVLDKKRLQNICDLLQDNKTVYWGCNSRVTDVNQDMLEMLKSAGCIQLAFGIESGNPRIIKEVLHKNATIEQAKEAVRLCHENGIIVQSNFMIGNPTETEEEMMDTLKFIRENKIDGSLGVSATIPFPMTGLWKWCDENRKFPESISWESFNYSEYPIHMCDVTPERFREIRGIFAKECEDNRVKTSDSREQKVHNWKRSVGL
jgi:anaerobic magnesium-protoporphyrin IX monomethyl ester cyclase